MTEFLNTLLWTFVVFGFIVAIVCLMAWFVPEVRDALARWEDK